MPEPEKFRAAVESIKAATNALDALMHFYNDSLHRESGRHLLVPRRRVFVRIPGRAIRGGQPGAHHLSHPARTDRIKRDYRGWL